MLAIENESVRKKLLSDPIDHAVNALACIHTFLLASKRDFENFVPAPSIFVMLLHGSLYDAVIVVQFRRKKSQ